MNAPTGAVLYDQTGATLNSGGQVLQDSASPGYDSEGADDFVVSDANGWTISQVNANLSFNATPPGALTYNVEVYPDNAGAPGTTPACSALAQTGTLGPPSGAGQIFADASIPLAVPCVLASAGTYWLSVTPVFNFPPQSFWATLPATTIGAEAHWRNPNGAYATGCADWSPMSGCVFNGAPIGDGDTAFGFQILGAVNGGGGGCAAGEFCLDVTLGTDTTAGACGTVDTLDVTLGDQVNYCYTITNNSGVSLDFHTLTDNIDGTIFSLMNQVVADGSTFQYNRIDTAGVTETRTSNWAAQDVPPGYTAEIVSGGGGITDRIFCDGFDGEACDPGGSGGFIDISTTGTALGLTDDGEADVTMPFSFTLYGTTSNQLTIGNNGGALFGITGGQLGFTNGPIPDATLGHAILPLWDDFDEESGDVYYETQGTAPNRKFIVEWFNRPHFNGTDNTDTATFEFILEETTNKVTFQYLDVAYSNTAGGSDPTDCTNGVCATIGLQDSGTLANQFSFMEASITDNSGIEWTATAPQTFTDDDTTTVNVGAPDIDVTPATIGGSVPEGGTTTFPMTVANVGDRDLVWTPDEAPAADAHFPPPGSRFAMPLGDPALASAGPAPRHAQAKQAGSSGIQAPFGAAVPAFAADVLDNVLITFDATAPGATTQVAPNVYKLVGGTFIDGDLSTMYSIDGFNTSANFNDFVSVDVATGAVTEIASAPNSLGEGWTSLDYDSTTGNLYGSSVTCGSASHLWTIDRISGATTQVGEITGGACIIAIAVDPTGLMYGLDIVSDSLFAIDKTTGVASLIGSIGFNANYAQDMTFDQSTGILYLAGYDALSGVDSIYTMDLTTGAATVVGPIGAGTGEVDAIAIQTAGGPCSQPADQPWLTITPSGENTTAAGGSTPVTLGIDPGAAVEGDTLSGTVCVTSNDPDEHTVAVPVEVTVGTGGGGGDIVDSGVVNIPITADTNGLYINWLTGAVCTTASGGGCSTVPGAYDFNAYGGTNLTFFWSGGVAATSDCVTSGTPCAVLTSGTEIGSASTFGNGNANSFRLGGTLYMGFRFLNTSTAETNYGYAVLTTTGPTTGYPAVLTRYVYNSAGDAITIP